MLSVEVATPDELALVLEVLPRLKLRDIARVRVSCEDEIRRRVAALARKQGMDVESAIIGAQPVAELEGVPGCVVRLAECDEDDDEGDDADELLEPTDIYEPHELRLLEIEIDTE